LKVEHIGKSLEMKEAEESVKIKAIKEMNKENKS
jgi:hypothetical protein